MLTVVLRCAMMNMLGQLRTARSFFFGPAKKEKEMTLDCLFFLRTSFSVKGHFCSFLLSNIIGYLAFLNLDFFAFHLFLILILKNLLCLTPSIEKVTFSFSLSDFGFDELLCPFDSRCLGIFSDP